MWQPYIVCSAICAGNEVDIWRLPKSYERTCQFSRQERGGEFFLNLLDLGEELRLVEAWDKPKVATLEKLAWTQEFRGPDSEATMWTIAVLATNAECLKELESSLRYRKEELGLRGKIFEGNPGKIIDCMVSISNLSSMLGELGTSLSMIMEVLRIGSTLDDCDCKDDMPFLADLAATEVYMKNWEAFVVYCRQIIEFYRNHSQALSSHLILAEVNMGLALFGLESFNDAEAHATRSVGIHESLSGEEHISTMKAPLSLTKITFEQEITRKRSII
jgi:hypothetical protein